MDNTNAAGTLLSTKEVAPKQGRKSKFNKNRLIKNIKEEPLLYVMFALPLIYFILFKYLPMVGIVISFQDYKIGSGFKGFFTSEWVGLNHFKDFLSSFFFGRLIRNTLGISLLDIAINFPAPIILALIFNEIRNGAFKKITQTISYLPRFISVVVIVSMYIQFLSLDRGLINNIIAMFGGERVFFLAQPKYFWLLFTFMNTWAGIGWGSIIYLSALSGVNQELYEACKIDGGNRFRQIWHVSLPGIANTITIMLILRVGAILSVSAEAILLLYNPAIYDTADVISTYVYRQGLLQSNYSYATAVGLFQAVIGFILVITTNKIAKKYSENSLW